MVILDYFGCMSIYFTLTGWIAYMEIGLDPNNSVIKRLCCSEICCENDDDGGCNNNGDDDNNLVLCINY